MSARDLIVKIVNRACRLPVIGPLVLKAKKLWKKMVQSRPSLRDMVDYQAMAIQGLEQNARHLENLNKRTNEKLGWLSTDNDNLRQRIEFVRQEMMFELRRFIEEPKRDTQKASANPPLIINHKKLAASGPKRLNVGCGHVLRADYINVDGRELPGVDVVCDVLDMPAELSSVDEIYASHLVEHFSELTLKTHVLPYWLSCLKSGGRLVLVAPNADAMMRRYCSGEIGFDQVREILFGGQEYEGDFHYTMLSPQAMTVLLESAGFEGVEVVASERANGACLEFEIRAAKP